MKTQMRIFWLVSLLFFTTGCGVYQPACFTGTEGISNDDMSQLDDCRLQAGETVRITTTDGNRVIGEIKRITGDWIVLAQEGKKEPLLLLTPSRILVIEKSKAKPKDQDNLKPPEIGDEVEIYLVDGSLVRGEVFAQDDREIALFHESGEDQVLGLSRDEILWVETNPHSTSKGASWVGPVVFVVLAGIVVGGAIAASELSELNNMFEN